MPHATLNLLIVSLRHHCATFGECQGKCTSTIVSGFCFRGLKTEVISYLLGQRHHHHHLWHHIPTALPAAPPHVPPRATSAGFRSPSRTLAALGDPPLAPDAPSTPSFAFGKAGAVLHALTDAAAAPTPCCSAQPCALAGTPAAPSEGLAAEAAGPTSPAFTFGTKCGKWGGGWDGAAHDTAPDTPHLKAVNQLGVDSQDACPEVPATPSFGFAAQQGLLPPLQQAASQDTPTPCLAPRHGPGAAAPAATPSFAFGQQLTRGQAAAEPATPCCFAVPTACSAAEPTPTPSFGFGQLPAAAGPLADSSSAEPAPTPCLARRPATADPATPSFAFGGGASLAATGRGLARAGQATGSADAEPPTPCFGAPPPLQPQPPQPLQQHVGPAAQPAASAVPAPSPPSSACSDSAFFDDKENAGDGPHSPASSSHVSSSGGGPAAPAPASKPLAANNTLLPAAPPLQSGPAARQELQQRPRRASSSGDVKEVAGAKADGPRVQVGWGAAAAAVECACVYV